MGRRKQPAVIEAHADIAAAAGGQAAIEYRAAKQHDLFAQTALLPTCRDPATHDRCFHALRKKSGAPKLPDFNASAKGFASPFARSAIVQGTPGSISRPIRNPLTPSALTTAPEVSPPATIN